MPVYHSWWHFHLLKKQKLFYRHSHCHFPLLNPYILPHSIFAAIHRDPFVRPSVHPSVVAGRSQWVRVDLGGVEGGGVACRLIPTRHTHFQMRLCFIYLYINYCVLLDASGFVCMYIAREHVASAWLGCLRFSWKWNMLPLKVYAAYFLFK